MLKNSFIRNLALVVMLVALAAGVIHLFMLRFQTGDIYPAYSSLRSDPLGTRVFYDSLDNFDDLTLRRNYLPLHSLKSGPVAAFFYLGAEIPTADSIPTHTSDALDRLTRSGGRLVIAYLPISRKTDKMPGCQKANGDNPNPGNQAESDLQDSNPVPEPDSAPVLPPTPQDPQADPPAQDAPPPQMVSIKAHWGFEFACNDSLPVTDPDKENFTLEAHSRRPDLPAAISWHSNLYFKLIDKRWQTLYTVDENPVIIERPMGRGTVVLCADAFFISNEALGFERHPALLVWLLGGHSNIIFDESHLGIYQRPGVAGLLRQYRFDRFLGALALVALLFVWKNALYFVPPRREDISSEAAVVSDKDYTQGLTALLRRNITAGDILPVCAQEWEQTFKNDPHIKSGAAGHLRRLLQSESRSSAKKPDPVSGYRKISSLFKRLGVYSRK